MEGDEVGKFIVNSESMGIQQGYKTNRTNYSALRFHFSERAETPGKSFPSSNLYISRRDKERVL